MLFMVIEHFKNRDGRPIYERFAEKGRMMPDGLNYLDSWVEENFNRCFQLMETEDPALFDAWIAEWKDLMDFEVIPVQTSQQARSLFNSDS
ncbi:MAG TPA: DUF3303 family protein [Pyrinomonadaceae bacterium]|nr:DUF3303 family protein [Pyrinomonadaceae bacterium]